MSKINTVAHDFGCDGFMYRVEQGNHLVKLKGWEGVASHVVGGDGKVEGTLVWFPSTCVEDLV